MKLGCHVEQLNALAMPGTLEPCLEVWFSAAMLGRDIRISSQAGKQLPVDGPSGPELFELALLLFHTHHNLLLLLRAPGKKASASHVAPALPKHMLEPITSQNLE